MQVPKRVRNLSGFALLPILAAAACTNGHAPHATHQTASAPGAKPSSQASASANPTHHPSGPSTSHAPNLAEDEIPTLTTASSVIGNAEYPLRGGIKSGHTLAIAVNCQGKGTLTVVVEPAGIGFPLHCTSTEVSPTFNEIGFKTPHANSFVRFTAVPSTIKWSFAAGWDPHPPSPESSDG
ncbi:hypothetical protein ACWCP8_27715 [Streptomyces sp. NPDC002206]